MEHSLQICREKMVRLAQGPQTIIAGSAGVFVTPLSRPTTL